MVTNFYPFSIMPIAHMLETYFEVFDTLLVGTFRTLKIEHLLLTHPNQWYQLSIKLSHLNDK